MKKIINFQFSPLKIARFHNIIAIIFAVIMTYLYFYGMIVNIKLALPHVMMFSTLLLMVIGLCFTLMPGLQSREYDDEVRKNWKKIKNGFFQNIHDSVMFSIGVVLVSLCILVLKVEPYIVFKIIITPLGSFLFANMIMTSIGEFTVTLSYFRME